MNNSSLIALKKVSTVFVSLALLGMTQASFAEHDSDNRNYNAQQTSYVYATVTSVKPIVRYVTVSRPERVCEEVEVYNDRRRHSDSAGGTIVGGLLGGVIGRQIGGGKGRDAATIAGVLIGSAIGHDNEHKNQSNSRSHNSSQVREVCQTRYSRHEEERIDGYRVTYRYNGELFTTRTNYEPGDKIRLLITARPAPDNYRGATTTNRQYRNSNDDRYSEYDDSE